MSRSEETVPLNSDTTSAVVSQLERLADEDNLAAEDMRAIVSAATRLYANACRRVGEELPPVTDGVTTTDAITLACALVRCQDLTPCEMSMWFSRGKTHG